MKAFSEIIKDSVKPKPSTLAVKSITLTKEIQLIHRGWCALANKMMNDDWRDAKV